MGYHVDWSISRTLALWLSPIYISPQFDFGYNVANYTDVDKDYGTLADFDKLVAKAKSLGLKVIPDFVPNHSSHEHGSEKVSSGSSSTTSTTSGVMRE